jgi:hypothetical protein
MSCKTCGEDDHDYSKGSWILCFGKMKSERNKYKSMYEHAMESHDTRLMGAALIIHDLQEALAEATPGLDMKDIMVPLSESVQFVKAMDKVREAAQAACDAYIREGVKYAGAVVNARVVPAIDAFNALKEG